MARYVDGFVLPCPLEKVADYRKMATTAGEVWREHGALQYVEAVLEDDEPQGAFPFKKAFDTKPGETVIFAWIVFNSRAHRDEVNAKVMADPRMQSPGPEGNLFDHKRMAYGGFDALVDLSE
jgi:uncharacterized protein YbaA (DUF1428 family)